MTVSTSTAKSGPYAGSGTTGPFTVSFRFLANSHLRVIRTSAAGVDTDLVLTTDYSVTGAGAASGTVTLVSPLPVGEKLTIVRNVPLTQEADYVAGDAFPAESHEQALDKLTMITQQLEERVDAAFTLPATVTGVSTTLPVPAANSVVAWNASATALQNIDAATFATIVAFGTSQADTFSGNGAQTAFTLTFNPGAQANLDVSIGGVVQAPGVDYIWTGGQTVTFTEAPPTGTNNVLIRYFQALPQGSTDSAASTYVPAGTGAVATNVQTKLRESVSVKDFGAVGNGVADDTAAIQAAIDYIANSGGGTVLLGAGVYLITATLTDYNTVSPTSNGKTVRLKGVGASEVSTDTPLTRIKTSGAIVGIHFNGNRSGGEDFIIEGDNGAFDGTSHGILVDSSRSYWRDIVTTKHRGDGIKFRFGNVSHFESILCLSNKGNGFNIDGTGYVTPAGVSRPNDANASTFITIDARSNGQDGIRTGVNSTFSNFFYNITAQGNTSYGVEFNGDLNQVFGLYVEGNDSGSTPAYDIRFSSTADNNHLFGVFSNYAYPATGTNGVFLDSSASMRNYVHPFTSFTADAECGSLTLGSKTAGIAGYIVFDGDDGVQPKISLEGTSATQTLKITSSGAGDLGIDPDFITAEAWTAPSLLNSWVNFGGSRTTAGFWKDKFGVVYLRGVIRNGTTTNPTALFQLPAGYRPTGRERFATVSNGAFASLFIDADGNVYYESGSNVEFSLSGVFFRTA